MIEEGYFVLKIRVNPFNSGKLQKYLFDNGYTWNNGDKIICNIFKRYIIVWSDSTFSWSKGKDGVNKDSIISYKKFINNITNNL